MDDGCQIIDYLNMDSWTLMDNNTKTVSTDKGQRDILISSSEIRLLNPKLKNWCRESEAKETNKPKTAFWCYVDLPGSTPCEGWQCSLHKSMILAVAAGRFPGDWSLQRWGLHGDHYSRFHMLNKRNCGKNTVSNLNDAYV